MVYRVAWFSPFTPASGVGTFSMAITGSFPTTRPNGEELDLTILHGPADEIYPSRHRCITVSDGNAVQQFLDLFDIVIYNTGNNREHHEIILDCMKVRPGIVIMHDYVYQHHLAARLMSKGAKLHNYASLLSKYGGSAATKVVAQSRVTARTGRTRYPLWDTDHNVDYPLIEMLSAFGSAIVVHSAFAHGRLAGNFSGPVLQLGMPSDQKTKPVMEANLTGRLARDPRLHLVSFGHIQKTKCIEMTLYAIRASKLLCSDLRYTVAGFVGSEWYLNELKEIIRSSSLEQTVTIARDLSEAQLSLLKNDADVFINLRKPNTEGSSASLTEQLMSGRPVVVFDSGCYAEIPEDAAIKIHPQASVHDLKEALECLLSGTQPLEAIGEKGRQYASQWTCRRYVEDLLSFIAENEDLLVRRSHIVGLARIKYCPHPDDVHWSAMLGDARKTMTLFDAGNLSYEPAPFMQMSGADMARFVAQTIIGIFDNHEILNALVVLFTPREPINAYLEFVKLAILSDAVFHSDENAVDRLAAFTPIYDLDFWAVIEQFELKHYLHAAAIILKGEQPAEDSLELIDGETKQFVNRRILDILNDLPSDGRAPLHHQLEEWLSRPATVEANELPTLNGDVLLSVGDKKFDESVNLFGFYGAEDSRVWVEGKRGLVELQLGASIRRVQFLVILLHASVDNPCTAALSVGSTNVESEIHDSLPHWLSVERLGSVAPSSTVWFEIKTSLAAPPLNSNDGRMLGICILEIKLLAE